MTDLSKLSDAELQALYGGTGAGKPVSEMSDAELQAAYGTAPKRGVMDKLFGVTGERYQTWPERLVRDVAKGAYSAVTFPGDVLAGKDNPENTARLLDMATMGTPVNPAMRAGDRLIPGVAKAFGEKNPAIPTTRELAEAGGRDISAAKSSGLELNSEALAGYSKELQQGLFDGSLFGKTIHPVDAPATFAKLKEIENAPSGSLVTAANLQALRESLQATAQNFNPAAAKDQLAASLAIKHLDRLLPSVAEKDVLAGSPSATQALFEKGRGNYAAGQRSNDINGTLDRATTGILERAEGRAQAANSGRNLDNTIRSKVESVLEKPKEVSGLSDAEIAALERVREGGGVRNTAREIGNQLGGGGGLGTSMLGLATGGTAAAASGNPWLLALGAVPPVIGTGARKLANALAKRDLNAADELMRKRSPLYEERLAATESPVISPERRAAAARAALIEALQQ